MNISYDWTSNELEYFLSLDNAALELWLDELSKDDQAKLLGAMVDHADAKASESPAKQSDDLVSSKGKLAAGVGISLPMLERYIAQGVEIPGPPYSVAQAREAIDAVRGSRSGADIDPGLRRQRLLVEIEEKQQGIRSKQLKNDLLDGRLMATDDARRQMAAMLLRIKGRLESLPDELQSLAPSDIRAQFRGDLQNAMYDLLLEMSTWRLDVDSAADEEPG